MNPVRIQFIKEGQVVKTFDRRAKDAADAKKLADDIARDSGIDHDSRNILSMRKFRAVAGKDGKALDGSMIESKAFDEVEAKKLAGSVYTKQGLDFTEVAVQFPGGN